MGIGAHGRVRLDTGEVTGQDPLQPYGDHAARVLRRAVMMPEAPDLYLNSRIEDATLDIAAFEPLVGAHGGLGGWQDRAILLTPRALAQVLPTEQIEGADRLHAVLGVNAPCGRTAQDGTGTAWTTKQSRRQPANRFITDADCFTQRGWVQRRANTGNSRSWFVQLTAAGWARYHLALPLHEGCLQPF